MHGILYTDKSSFKYINTKTFLKSQKLSTELSWQLEQLSITSYK